MTRDEMRRLMAEALIATVEVAKAQAGQPIRVASPPSFQMIMSDPKDEHAAPAPPR